MPHEHAAWLLLVGASIMISATLQAVSRRLRVPSMVGCLLLGTGLHWLDARWMLLGEGGAHAFGLLADLGLVAILFRVGLHCRPAALIARLRPAALIWIGNVSLAGGLGYLAARGTGLPVLPSVVIGIALTATSIGVAAAVWEELGALQTGIGQLMIDVAELDDISGVILMALLLATVPAVLAGAAAESVVLSTAALFALKFLAFAAFCFLVAKFLEQPLATAAARLRNPPERMLPVAGAGLVIAAIAGSLGFSLAIGALFAGLIFSGDPKAVREEANFDALYAFFAPFFFIGIGLQITPEALAQGAALGGWLLLAALAGKLIGGFIPALLTTTLPGALLIGVSLIPRAEIAMVIAREGRAAGALPDNAYAALVVVTAGTCLVAPWLMHRMLVRWPPAR